MRRLRGERGMVLPMALGIVVVLTIAVTSAIYYTTENQRSAGYSSGKQTALALAEAGLNNSVSVLNLPANNALKQVTLPKCTNNAQSNWNRTNLAGGYVLWCGDLDRTGLQRRALRLQLPDAKLVPVPPPRRLPGEREAAEER